MRDRLNRIGFKLRFRRRFRNAGFIHPKSTIGSKVKIGRDTNINGKAFLPNGTTIGNYCAIAHGLRIRTYSHRTNFINISDSVAKKYNLPDVSYYRGDVVIDDFVWIGDNVIIIGPARIGRGAVIGAGSVVTKDIEAWSINAGVPSKQISMRFSNQAMAELEDINFDDENLFETYRDNFNKNYLK